MTPLPQSRVCDSMSDAEEVVVCEGAAVAGTTTATVTTAAYIARARAVRAMAAGTWVSYVCACVWGGEEVWDVCGEEVGDV